MYATPTILHDCIKQAIGFRQTDCNDIDIQWLNPTYSRYYDEIGFSHAKAKAIATKDISTPSLYNAHLNFLVESGCNAVIDSLTTLYHKKLALGLDSLGGSTIPQIVGAREISIRGNGFVGQRFLLKENFALHQFKKIGLFFSLPQPLDLYLYRADNLDYLEKITLNYTNGGSVQWFDVDFNITKDLGISLLNTHGGVDFIIGYYEDDLIANNYAFRTKAGLMVNVENKNCSNCGTIAFHDPVYNKKQNDKTIFKATGLKVNEIDIDYANKTLPKVDSWNNVSGSLVPCGSENTYGVCLQLDSQCELSAFLCKNIRLLIDAQMNAVVWKIYFLAMQSLNINRANAITQTMAQEINNGIIGSLEKKYNDSIQTAFDSLLLLNDGTSLCLPSKYRSQFQTYHTVI